MAAEPGATTGAIAEAERALDTLRGEMVRAIREGDDDLYVSLANRYGRLNQHWEALQRTAQERARNTLGWQ